MFWPHSVFGPKGGHCKKFNVERGGIYFFAFDLGGANDFLKFIFFNFFLHIHHHGPSHRSYQGDSRHLRQLLYKCRPPHLVNNEASLRGPVTKTTFKFWTFYARFYHQSGLFSIQPSNFGLLYTRIYHQIGLFSIKPSDFGFSYAHFYHQSGLFLFNLQILDFFTHAFIIKVDFFLFSPQILNFFMRAFIIKVDFFLLSLQIFYFLTLTFIIKVDFFLFKLQILNVFTSTFIIKFSI